MTGTNRVVVVGSSGSGKTTVAREIASRVGVPYLELDAVRHAEDWDSTPDPEFQRIIGEFTSQEHWVVDGNYTSHGVREVIWPRADTIVWTDPPKSVVMRRVIGRTIKRVLTREELWDGVREPFTNLYSVDPYQNIVVWAWRRFDHVRGKYETAMTDGSWDHAAVYRLRSSADVQRFLESLR